MDYFSGVEPRTKFSNNPMYILVTIDYDGHPIAKHPCCHISMFTLKDVSCTKSVNIRRRSDPSKQRSVKQ